MSENTIGYRERFEAIFTSNLHSKNDHSPSFYAVLYSLVNSFLGVLLLSRIDKIFVVEEIDLIMIVGSFGAQATLVFAAPTSPLAQPWNCVLGNGISSFIGVSIYKV